MTLKFDKLGNGSSPAFIIQPSHVFHPTAESSYIHGKWIISCLNYSAISHDRELQRKCRWESRYDKLKIWLRFRHSLLRLITWSTTSTLAPRRRWDSRMISGLWPFSTRKRLMSNVFSGLCHRLAKMKTSEWM